MEKKKKTFKVSKEDLKHELKEIFTLNFDFFSSTRKTFENLAFCLATILIFVFFALMIGPKNYYTNHSDDVIQYFTISENYFLRLKNFDFSFFNLNNYFGASVYSDSYYVPIDIFTAFTYLTSLIFEFDFMFGLTELLKIFSGTMLFAYCLYLKKNSNKSIFITSFIYMCSGMFVCLMAFPAYLSMIFYLPLGYYCVLKFFDDHKYLMSIYVFISILYNFYIAYTLIWFTCFAYFIEFFQRDYLSVKSKTKKFFSNGFEFLGLILTGVLMGCVILYPAALYILNNTSRMESSHPLFDFDFLQYLRLLAKVFSPSVPTGFYGFQNSYVMEHLGFNITIVGLILLLSIFKYRDKVSKTYQISLIVGAFFTLLPIFYMIFSGHTLPYTRWISGFMFIVLLSLGHAITKNDLKIDLYSKYGLIMYFLIISSLSFLIGTYLYQFQHKTDIWSKDVLTVELIYFMAMFLIIILVFALYKIVNLIPVMLLGEIIASMIFMFSVSFAPFNKIAYDNARNKLNTYMDEVLPDNTDEFYRIYIDYKAFTERTNGGLTTAEIFNFNRTNTQLTNFRFFHSFYDKNTDEFSDLLFNTIGYQTQKVADNSNIYFNHLFKQKYLITDSLYKMLEDDHTAFIDPKLFTQLENTKGYIYDTYQLNNNQEFIVYDKYLTNQELKSSSTHTISRIKRMTDNVIIKDYENSGLDLKHGNITDTKYSVKQHTKTPNPEKEIIRYAYYYVFDLSTLNPDLFNNSYLYFTYNNNTEVEEALYLDKNGNTRKCLNNVCYYDSPIEKLYVKVSGDVESNTTVRTSLKLLFDEYDFIDSFIDEQNTKYTNKKLTYNNDKFKVSYQKTIDEENIVYLPITYSKFFKVDKEYKTLPVNGGFLGIQIPKGVTEVEFTVKYVEENFYNGLFISIGGFIIFGGYLTTKFIIKKKKNKKENETSLNEEENNYNQEGVLNEIN